MFYDEDNLDDAIAHDVSEAKQFLESDIVVYIENEEDERFWAFVLNEAKPGMKVKFDARFKEKNNENIGQGKQQLYKFKDAIKKFKGEALICIDSDFDYINNFNDINNNPFIIQTYTYSVENYICCEKTLNLTKNNLLIKSDFNFKNFYDKYSPLLEELIIFNILLKDNENENIKKIFTTYFLKIDTFTNLDDFNTLLNLSDLEDKINTEIERIKSNNDYNQADYDKIAKIIKEDPLINEKRLLMYFHGHTIYDISNKILKKMLAINYNNEREIIKSSFTGEQRNQKLKEYNNKRLCSKTALISSFNHCYFSGSCPSFNQIILDVREVVENVSAL